VLLRWVVGEQEEGSTRGVVAAPPVGDIEGAPAGDDRPALKHFLEHRAVETGDGDSIHRAIPPRVEAELLNTRPPMSSACTLT
jgi:hypothetical protein